MINPEELAQMEREVDEEIAEAVAYAEAGALEPVSEVERFVTMENVPS
jgi:pyruvate dehydrogenase E1 component subunit alpha